MSAINRRKFLSLGSAALAFSAIPIARSTPSKKLGVALLGLGSYSRGVLAPALQHTQYCALTGIVTGTPAKIPQWQSRYGIKDANVYSYDTLHQIANNPDIDVVYIVTPTSLHMKYAVAAANAGKHVWCEKPMAMTVKECQTIIDVCHKNNVKLSIGYRMQHEPNTRAFAQFAKQQPYGHIQSVSAYAGYSGGPGPASDWRMQKDMGGGALYDMGVYPINGVRFVMGLEPIAVKAKIEPHAGFKEVDATTYFTLQFADGVEADCGTSVVKGFNHLKVNCHKGWYELRPMQSYSGVRGYTSDNNNLIAFKGIQQAHQMDNDALAILGKGPILVPGEEGLKDIHLVQKILQSAETSQGFVLV